MGRCVLSRPGGRAGVRVLAVLVAGGTALVIWVNAPRGPAGPETFFRLKGNLAQVETLGVSIREGTRIEELELRGSRGLRVRVLIRSPAGEPHPRPALVLLGGLHTGRRAALAVPSDPPMVIASIDYLRAPPSGISLPRALASLPTFKRGAEESIAGVLLLLDHLETRPDVDRQCTVLVGGSLGALFAAIAGAIDSRFEGVALLYGGGDLRTISQANLPFHSRLARRGAAWAISPWLSPVDPLGFVPLISPRPLLLVNGRDDRQIPRECVLALYQAAAEPKELHWLDTPHRVQGKPEMVAEVAETVFTWMGRHGWLDHAPESSVPQ